MIAGLTSYNDRRRAGDAWERADLDIVEVVPSIVVVCNVEIVHIVIVVIVVVIVIVVVAVSIVDNICSH